MPDNKGWEEGAIASYSLAIEGRGHTYAFRLKGSKKNYSDARGKRFGEDELRKEKPETWEEGDGIEGAYSQELKEKSEDNEASTEQAWLFGERDKSLGKSVTQDMA